jgi:hypothetical protein
MSSALVLTGDSTLADLESLDAEFWPTFVLEQVGSLLPKGGRNEF